MNKIREFKSIIGILQYLIKSRPDIATVLSFAASNAENPTLNDFDSIYQIINYLYRSKDKGLIIHKYEDTYNSNSNNEYFRKVLLQIICHVDASYLTHPDSKSHSGWTISFGLYGSFLNKSKKQQKELEETLKTLQNTLKDLDGMTSMLDDMKNISEKLKFMDDIDEDTDPEVALEKMRQMFEEDENSEKMDTKNDKE